MPKDGTHCGKIGSLFTFQSSDINDTKSGKCPLGDKERAFRLVAPHCICVHTSVLPAAYTQPQSLVSDPVGDSLFQEHLISLVRSGETLHTARRVPLRFRGESEIRIVVSDHDSRKHYHDFNECGREMPTCFTFKVQGLVLLKFRV